MSNIKDLIKKGLLAMAAVVVGVALLFALAGSYRVYSVWSASKQGQADLALAENSRKVLVEQAKAEKLAAQERADAIKIVGEAASRYPAYRYQEFLGDLGESIRNGNVRQIIYIPTEAGLPILEAGKRLQDGGKKK
ncbi:MAG: hypothetical protein OXU34_00805 [Gammaproteobacteria bacterium]|nr:hypothetical protein [Gammaproteobacteria bacterium]